MDYTKQVEEIILSRKNNPVDLLQLGLGEEEYTYLQNLQLTYTRTLNDVVPFLQKEMHVLEIGALFGVVSIALKKSGFNVVATEYPLYHQSKNLQRIYSENNITFDSLDLQNGKLPYQDQSFDAVIICEVIEHLNFNPIHIFQEINRILKKDGIIYLAMPNQANLYNRIKFLFGRSIHPPIQEFFDQVNKNKNNSVSMHWREYTMKEGVEILQKTGFNIVKKYFFRKIGADKVTVLSAPRYLLYLFFLYLFAATRPSQVIIARKS